MSAIPDGKYFWLSQPGGPQSIILLDVANVDFPIITSANDNIGDTVGRFTAISDNPSDTFTYSIVADPDNKFSIVGDLLKVAKEFNYTQVTQHSLTVRVMDQNGQFLDVSFIITLDETVGGIEITNVLVEFDNLQGEGVLDDAVVGVIHNIVLTPTSNSYFGSNSLADLMQLHVIELDPLIGEGVLDEMIIAQPPVVLTGTSALDDLVIIQIHRLELVSPVFTEQYLLPELSINPIFLVPILGYAQLETLKIIKVNSVIYPEVLIGNSHIGRLDALVRPFIVGRSVINELELTQQHSITLVAVNGSANLGTMVVVELP